MRWDAQGQNTWNEIRTPEREARLLSSSSSVTFCIRAILDWSSLVFFSGPFGEASQLACAKVHVCMLSHVKLFVTPWTAAHQAPLSMGFSRQEYWSGLPCPPPGDLPNPGIEPASPASSALQADFFTWEAKVHSFSFQFLSQTCFKGRKTFLLTPFEGKETCCWTDFRLGAACPLPGRSRPGPCRPHTGILIENCAAWGRN